MTPRYDGHAAWYDDWNAPKVPANAAAIQDLLGPGDGLCLDLGCGTDRNIRSRYGMRQHPLAELLTAFLSAGLRIEHVAEPGDRPVPVVLAIRAVKPGR